MTARRRSRRRLRPIERTAVAGAVLLVLIALAHAILLGLLLAAAAYVLLVIRPGRPHLGRRGPAEIGNAITDFGNPADAGCCAGWTPEDGCRWHTGRPAMSVAARELGQPAPVASLAAHRRAGQLAAENAELRRQVAELKARPAPKAGPRVPDEAALRAQLAQRADQISTRVQP
jgi:hypothetical protein